MSVFGERLRYLLDEAELKNKDFAKEMHVEPPAVTKWLNGDNFPKEDSLIAISDFFNVTLDYLLGRTDSRNNKVYETNVDGEDYKIEINKQYPYDLSSDDVLDLITQLKEVGFDVDKLIEKAKRDKKSSIE